MNTHEHRHVSRVIRPVRNRMLPTPVLLWIVICLAGPASAADQTRHSGAVDAAMTVLDEFMLTFNRRDIDAWSSTLNYPHVRFASGSVSVWEDRAAFASGRSFDALAAIGWDHSHWLSRKVVLAAQEKVHIATVFQRFNSDNESIGTYESLYIVTRVDGRWGVQARSSLAP